MDQPSKKCHPCAVGVVSLKGKALRSRLSQLDAGWKLIEEHRLEKEYHFKNFKEALAFVNRIGLLAEQEGHHPDVYLTWGKVILQYWTHAMEGLSEADFILAAKSDACFP